MKEKKILMLTTGGTIGGNIAGKNEKKAATDFLKNLNHTILEIKEKWFYDVVITPETICDVDSSNILPSHWKLLSDKIKKEYDEYDSFIITHGTNTMAYTAAALSFSIRNNEKPIILTGSQVPFGKPGSDALMNLDNAIRLATWSYDKIMGVVVVFGSHIISGTRVKKSTEFDYDAFQSFTTASIGRIGRIITIDSRNLAKHNEYLDGRTIKNNRFVDEDMHRAEQGRQLIVQNNFEMNLASLTEFPGMDVNFFKSLVENNGVKGFILRAFGAGDASNELRKGFEYLKRKRIPIIVTTQAPSGNANFQVNEPGQELKELDLAIPAFNMSMESQITKLAWLLGQSIEYSKLKEYFHADFKGEIDVLKELSQ